MSEKNILAYFHSPKQAEQALQQMKGLQIIDSQIDQISRFIGEGIDHIMNPITGDFQGLGQLTQDANFTSKNAAILAAADVTASGMSDGGQDAVTGRNILLTVVIEESDFDAAMDIVKQHGGMA